MYKLMLKICAAALGSLFPFLAEAQSAIHINDRREIFVDYHLLDRLTNTRLVMQPPKDEGPVMYFNEAWEGRSPAYTTILKDGDIYKAYYRGWNYEIARSEPQVTCYAESKDGINWVKPVLRLFESNGSRENNIILTKFPETHNFSPFIDRNPKSKPDQKYKAIGGNRKEGLFVYASPDGINWALFHNKAVFSKGAFDSQNVVFWSESEKKYVCYFRTFTDGSPDAPFNGVRTVSRTTSDDFVHWTEPVRMQFGDTPYEHLYTQQTSPYFRAPHIYIAIGGRFVPDRSAATEAQQIALDIHPNQRKALMDVFMMSTRGGDSYDRTFMEAFIKPGLGFNNWCARCNYPTLNIVQTGPEEMSLYVAQDFTQPTSHLRRYSMRLDGLTSINAPYAGGEVITKPFVFAGKELEINYSTSAAGEMRFELQEANGKPVPGYSLDESNLLIGNEIKKIVSWKKGTDLGGLAGKAVRLRIYMKDADLYSIKFN